ncbi:MAG: tetratricopeptide repeat protein [candidate division Zixibacteria bacterium]|nr:tetratricopeptide repeat protein [candidate division Zixibacteria bacterium]
MISMHNDPPKRSNQLHITALVSLLMLMVYYVATWFPQGRVWGLNLWAYFPSIVPLGLLTGGLLVVTTLWLFGRRRNRPDDATQPDIGVTIFWAATAAMTLLMTVLFFYLRARTHFLGDGYTVLSLLAAPEPLVKTREYGAAMLHIWVKQLWGSGEPAALASFRSISIGCGLLFLMSTALLSGRLFQHNRDRFLFLAGLASCGYMYNFFGYVENYSLFILTSLLYCMTGLLVSLGRAPRWTIPPLLGLTVLSHIFGVVFLPATIYLMLAGTTFGNRVGRWSTKTKGAIAAGLSVVGILTFLHFYFNYYYFRFAIVPLLPDRFTVEGYHLFSLGHLVDIINLALLLVPALPIVIVLAFAIAFKRIFRRYEYRYLDILVLSCWAAMFIFDPKLGMPRDWDLFSFAGIPLALFCFYFVLDPKVRPARYIPITLMMIVLASAMLFPRAVSQTNPDQSVVWFDNYGALDKTKNMYGRTLLKKYYDRLGDVAAADQAGRQYVTDYPQFVLNRQGIALKDQGKCAEAIEKYRAALELHPTFVAPYANIGMCYLILGQLDSAEVMLRIAVGMNPYNHLVHNTLARTYFEKGNYAAAEGLLLRAHELSPSELEPLVGLVQLYKKTNKLDNWFNYLNQLVARDDAPLVALNELADYHLNHRRYLLAAPLFRRAVPLGLDSAYLAHLRRNFPQLGL